MDLLASVVGVATAAAVGIGLIRTWQEQKDGERRDAKRQIWRQRTRDKEQARALEAMGKFYPFAQPAYRRHLESGKDAREALGAALAETPGVQIGRTRFGTSALLPGADRRKGLLILGKSGFGKTTIGLRLIRDDLTHGRGVCVLGSEAELFRDWLLPLVPPGRATQVINFQPADPMCPLTWNPLSLEEGDDQALAAGELFAIFKRAVGETSIGARADAILSSAFGILVGRPGATLWSVGRLLEDAQYREEILAQVDDPYLCEFWTKTFPSYPPNAGLPLANRLNQFLRLPQLRAALCHPVSSFSIRNALAGSRILFFDVSGLDPDATKLLGQILLSKFQIELMRRERIAEEDRTSIHVYVDEFHVFADSAEGTWRELLARGRRYGLGLHLFTQHPNQLSRSLQHEIFGNVSSIIALNLSASDAAVVRRELLVPAADGATKPIAADALVSLPVGEGFARLGSGACALKVRFAPPIEKPDPQAGERIRQVSYKTYAAPPVPPRPATASTVPTSAAAGNHPAAGSGTEDANRRQAPGRGGQQHKLLQDLARQWGEERGFRATIEEMILGGAGRVDVALARGQIRVAIEVAITTTPTQVAATVNKSLAADFGYVVVLSPNPALLRQVDARIAQDVVAGDRSKVHLLAPDDLRSFLARLPGGAEPDQTTAGYRVKVGRDPAAAGGLEARRQVLAQLVGSALLRQRWPS